ncbi:MAG: trypsin-like peptidase domain-containing protein [Oscillospiraceae bacterium]|nr:trypsin-like peptidase domain-containing protein [Oscillospiraceae bacterium]
MSNWYANENEGWYAPLHQAATTTETPKKKGRTWLKALVAVLVVIGLITGSALLFPNKNTAPTIIKPSQREDADDSNDSNFGQFIIPRDDEDETMPDDYREFFENFYTAIEDSRTSINIEHTELPKDFSCTVAPAGEELSLQELYRRCSQSIVAISGYMNGKSGYNWGTGVILSEDGLILTNTHVIADCDRATVTLPDDTVCEAKLVGADSISDIAVLKIEAKGLTPAVFGDSSALEVGDSVAAIGNPLGEEFRLTLTRGIISAIERGINYKGHSMNLLQTDTAINEGNSGGPLLNMYGQVIGITNMKMMSSYSSIEGIGFAIPSVTVVKIINTIVKEGVVSGRPSIGITVGMIPDEAREKWPEKMPENGGLYIIDVAEGSDALAKGIQPGDIILEVNGRAVSETAELSAMKDELSVGDTLHFKLLREGEIVELDVALVDTNDVYG